MIIAVTTAAAAALRQQTLSIPIVFVLVADPVGQGFVTNLARPEGNITGFTNFEFSMGGKWLQVLKECAPGISAVAVVFDPNLPTWAPFLRSIESAPPPFGIRLTPAAVRDAADIERRLAAFAREPSGALIVLASPVTMQNRQSIIAATARYRLPAVYPFRVFTAPSPLLAQSGHHNRANPCPLSGVKRTSLGHSEMSAFDPKQTFGPEDCCCAK